MNDLEKIGLVMQKLRNRHNLSQDDIAATSDMDRGYYSQIENGKRDIGITTLKRIAEALETQDWKILQEAEKL